MNRIMGVLGVMLAFVVVITVYMQMSVTANTTGWQPIMISTVQQYLPLLAVVAVIMFVIGAALVSRKG